MEAKGLDKGFSWDEPQTLPEDFFNDSPEDLENKTNAENVIEELNNEEVDEVDEKTQEQLEDEIFSDDTEDIDDEEIEEDELDTNDNPDKNKNKQDKVSPSVLSANLLKEKGIIDFELEEGEELTDELADELVEEGFDNAVDNRVKELFDGLPDIFPQMVKFVKEGGDPNEFLATVIKQSSTGISAGLDMEKESNQELVMRNTLKEQGYDDEYIDLHIDNLKDANKLKSVSEKQYNLWNKKNEKETAELVEKQTKQRELEKQTIKNNKNKLAETLNSIDDLGGIKLNAKDKKELPSYMYDKTVTLNNGATITNFHKEVWEAMGNEKTALQLAKLLRTRTKDGSFDFSKIEKTAKTEYTRKIKNEVQRNKNEITPNKSTRGGSRKELHEFF